MIMTNFVRLSEVDTIFTIPHVLQFIFQVSYSELL